jgi:hypothetical protein
MKILEEIIPRMIRGLNELTFALIAYLQAFVHPFMKSCNLVESYLFFERLHLLKLIITAIEIITIHCNSLRVY